MRRIILGLAVLTLAGVGSAWAYREHEGAERELVRQELSGLVPARAYDAQKVVYHLTDTGGFLGRRHLARLGSIANHADALGPGRLDARVVLQGDGISLLTAARTDEAIRRQVDALRARGVRFEICRNSLVDHAVRFSDLEGASPADLVPAAVAEIAALEAAGYVYLRL